MKFQYFVINNLKEQRKQMLQENEDEENTYNKKLTKILNFKQHELKSIQMLLMNRIDNIPNDLPFEDSDIILYRQSTIQMEDRIKNLEKLLNPVRCICCILCYF